MHQILILALWVYLRQLERIVFTVHSIDSSRQIPLEETGFTVIPGGDQYEVMK